MRMVTEIGEGKALVEVEYHIDSDGDLDQMDVLLGNRDITDAISKTWLDIIEQKCFVHAIAMKRSEARERMESRARDRELELMAQRDALRARYGYATA